MIKQRIKRGRERTMWRHIQGFLTQPYHRRKHFSGPGALPSQGESFLLEMVAFFPVSNVSIHTNITVVSSQVKELRKGEERFFIFYRIYLCQ